MKLNGNEHFKVIQNPGFLPHHPQNWITGSFYHSRHALKISERAVHNFLRYLANTQTDKQTNKVWQKHNLLGGDNYYSLAKNRMRVSVWTWNATT